MTDGTLCFTAEWFDMQAQLVRVFNLLYFPVDNTVELYDVKNRRTFLKRCSYPQIKQADLYLGAQVTVYARQLKLVDYGDSFTRNAMRDVTSRALVLIRPEAVQDAGKIIDRLTQRKFIVAKLKMISLTQQQAQEFYGDRQPSSRSDSLSRGPAIALEIVGSDASAEIKSIIASDPSGPFSAVHVSNSEPDALREIAYLLESKSVGTTATFSGVAVAIVKPHAVTGGQLGVLLQAILDQESVQVSAAQMFKLDRQAAEEFLEVYKGVVPEYNNMVEELVAGPCVALELSGQEVVTRFRELVGPSDPDIARHIRPHTLRAKFGKDKVENALHCTDLPEDGELESEFFFNILQKAQ